MLVLLELLQKLVVKCFSLSQSHPPADFDLRSKTNKSCQKSFQCAARRKNKQKIFLKLYILSETFKCRRRGINNSYGARREWREKNHYLGRARRRRRGLEVERALDVTGFQPEISTLKFPPLSDFSYHIAPHKKRS